MCGPKAPSCCQPMAPEGWWGHRPDNPAGPDTGTRGTWPPGLARVHSAPARGLWIACAPRTAVSLLPGRSWRGEAAPVGHRRSSMQPLTARVTRSGWRQHRASPRSPSPCLASSPANRRLNSGVCTLEERLEAGRKQQHGCSPESAAPPRAGLEQQRRTPAPRPAPGSRGHEEASAPSTATATPTSTAALLPASRKLAPAQLPGFLRPRICSCRHVQCG